jgi:hypothetical protein
VTPVGDRSGPQRGAARASLVGRLAPGLGYAAGLAAGTALPHRDAILHWASTNLVNLRHHPVGALLVSAFVTESDPVGWIVLGVVGLTATAWVLGGWRTVLLVATAHVVGTLVSEGILAYRIHVGAAPRTDELLMDVGASYIVVCALVAGMAYGTWPGRLLSAVGFLLVSPNLFGGLPHLEVSSVGHVTSIAVALGLGWTLRRAARRAARRPAPKEPEPVC